MEGLLYKIAIQHGAAYNSRRKREEGRKPTMKSYLDYQKYSRQMHRFSRQNSVYKNGY